MKNNRKVNKHHTFGYRESKSNVQILSKSLRFLSTPFEMKNLNFRHNIFYNLLLLNTVVNLLCSDCKINVKLFYRCTQETVSTNINRIPLKNNEIFICTAYTFLHFSLDISKINRHRVKWIFKTF